MGLLIGLMGRCTRACGKMIRCMEVGVLSTHLAPMKPGCGKMGYGRGPLQSQSQMSTQSQGCSTERASWSPGLRNGQMEKSTKASS
jgi:hypothetical protein